MNAALGTVAQRQLGYCLVLSWAFAGTNGSMFSNETLERWLKKYTDKQKVIVHLNFIIMIFFLGRYKCTPFNRTKNLASSSLVQSQDN